MHKEIKPLARACRRSGYEVVPSRDHYKVKRGRTTVTILPAKPDRGGPRWLRNKQAELRRLGIVV